MFDGIDDKSCAPLLSCALYRVCDGGVALMGAQSLLSSCAEAS